MCGTRETDAAGIAHTVVEQTQEQMQTKIQDYLHCNPPDYRFHVDSLLELLYIAFTEYNITETPEFKAKLDPLEQKLRSLAWAVAQGQSPGQTQDRSQSQLQDQSQPVQMARATPDDQSRAQLKTTPDQPQAQRLLDEVADGGEQLFYQRGAPLPGGVYSDQHGTAGDPGQGLLHFGGH